MVDIDDPSRHPLTHRFREHLHVACKNDQFSATLLDDLHLPGFGTGLRVAGDVNMVERNVVVHHQFLIFHVVRDDANNIDRQRPNPPPIQQVVQTVPEARNHDDDLAPHRLVMEGVLHPEGVGQGSKIPFKLRQPRTGL